MSEVARLDENFFARDTLQMPLQMPEKAIVVLDVDVLDVDEDVLQWFQLQGRQSGKMNAALRIDAEAHKRAA